MDAANDRVYGYVDGDPIQERDPRGECPWCAAVAIGATVGLVQSVVSGWISVDRDWRTLTLDAATGAISGGAAGAVAGFGLPALVARAFIGAGGEAYRHIGVGAITGCCEDPKLDIVLAGGASLFGDTAAVVYRGFAKETASTAMHYSVELTDAVGTSKLVDVDHSDRQRIYLRYRRLPHFDRNQSAEKTRPLTFT